MGVILCHQNSCSFLSLFVFVGSKVYYRHFVATVSTFVQMSHVLINVLMVSIHMYIYNIIQNTHVRVYYLPYEETTETISIHNYHIKHQTQQLS